MGPTALFSVLELQLHHEGKHFNLLYCYITYTLMNTLMYINPTM